jgi:hypothetical protein
MYEITNIATDLALRESSWPPLHLNVFGFPCRLVKRDRLEDSLIRHRNGEVGGVEKHRFVLFLFLLGFSYV